MRFQACFVRLSGVGLPPMAVKTGGSAGRRLAGAGGRMSCGAATLALALIVLGSLCAVRAQASDLDPGCTLHSLPSFVELSDGSVADVVEVRCETGYAGKTIALSSEELFNRCGHDLSWSSPDPYAPVTGPGVTVKVDNDGNATVALWGGPDCVPGLSEIEVAQVEEPYFAGLAWFTIEAPRRTTPGVSALPSSEIEDSTYSSVATIVEVEFPPADAEDEVSINTEQLYNSCSVAPHLVWVGPDENVLGTETDSTNVTLDTEGNAFVVLLGGASCIPGTSEIRASLDSAPYTLYQTAFTIKAPQSIKAICTANSGTVKLTPGLTGTPVYQSVKIKGTLTGCTGEPFTEAKYTATLTTTSKATCSALSGSGAATFGTVKYAWTPKTKATTGTFSMPLTETPGIALASELESGPYSPLTLSGTATESYTNAATCGIPQGRKGVVKPVTKGTFSGSFSGSAVSFE